MLRTEQANKNEFKPFTERECFLCDYAHEVMLIAYEEIKSNKPSSALLTLKYEAKGMVNRKMMKRLFWTVRRMGGGKP